MRAPLGLADFAGRWYLVRRVEDASGTSVFEGEAELSASPVSEDGTHLWTESGTLTMPGGAALHAERRYLWREAEAGIEVLFEDGRPFHVIDQGGGEIFHSCPPDTYRAAYDLAAFPRWKVCWRVTGPRKDYLSLTSLRRLAPSAPSRDTA